MSLYAIEGDSNVAARVNFDLTGAASVTAKIKAADGTVTDATCEITSATSGDVSIPIGSLDAGTFDVRAIVVKDGNTIHFPDYGSTKLFIDSAF